MRVIYKLWIILIFAGVITAWAGPTLSVTLDKTSPHAGVTFINETISTKARVQSYTNDNLQEELDQGGYVEYKYYFEYSSGQGGMVSTPTPNPTVFIDSKTCNTSGCFSGSVGSGWIRVTVTAHTCDRDGNEIPGSLTSDVASIEVAVIAVSSISANKNPVCVLQNVTFTAITNPAGYGNLVNWSGGGIPSMDSGTTFTTKWDTTGNKTVTALNKNIIEIVGTIKITNWEEYKECSARRQNPDEPHVYDGCSAPTGDNPAHDYNPDDCGEESSFYDCCIAHDKAFQICNSNRTTANAVFGSCLFNVCEEVSEGCYPTCQNWAEIYVVCVDIVGIIAWKNNQIKYCICCDEFY